MIKYVTGDATSPIGEGKKIIPHVCNNKNRWGAGFVLALSRKWSAPEREYHNLNNQFLANVQLVRVESDIYVANMIAQDDTRPDENGVPPIRYSALKICLQKVNDEAIRLNATIHAPKFGAGLSGGDWNTIEKIIKEVITVDVTIYEFK